ncbi:Hsp70 nucleotide exchange factor FES1 [Pleurostoma richardsiae]|uniref:Hsp70 nucleotide exchange factor FES1 n=1 Tax=Pleurostoma richardsiae TaxID=41990 RepID=A0AA38RB96_9PEZI|nr:Hsp70 nucleotide exchange factor FES1 [Pleurostoma richardsiae]
MAGPDRGLSELLKWSIENTPAADGNNTSSADRAPASRLNPEVIAALFGGPSDAELMQAAMGVITSTDPGVSLDDKLTAFDNLEQLIESLDNANNLAKLSLWTPLLGMLEHDERELRKMAAWCVGTAVQNNEPSQERLLAMGGIPALVGLATAGDEHLDVRRKAIYALSSAVRNYQPAMDAAAEELAKKGREAGKIDARNMDAVDDLINGLKEETKEKATAA